MTEPTAPLVHNQHRLVQQLGIGGFIVVAVLWMVFSFLVDVGVVSSRQLPDAGFALELLEEHKTLDKVDRLYEWHAVKDVDGLPVWYVPRAMHKSIDALSTVVGTNTEALRDLLRELEYQRRDRAEHDRSRHGGGVGTLP